MKFRKKPVVVEAIQFTGKNGPEIQGWSGDVAYESPALEPREGNPTGEYMQIETPEGIMTAIVGDWIVKGVKGEFYPCKSDIFDLTYEPVEKCPKCDDGIYSGVPDFFGDKPGREVTMSYCDCARGKERMEEAK